MNSSDSSENLSNQNLANKNLRYADLKNTNSPGHNCDNSHFDAADLGQAELSGASLKNTTCCGTIFVRAKLINADFSEANLSSADFSEANLSRSTFDKSILTHCNFNNANVTKAKFINCQGLTEDDKRYLRQRGAIVKNFPLANQKVKLWKFLARFVIVPLAITVIDNSGIVGYISIKKANCLPPESTKVVQNLKQANSNTSKGNIPMHSK